MLILGFIWTHLWIIFIGKCINFHYRIHSYIFNGIYLFSNFSYYHPVFTVQGHFLAFKAIIISFKTKKIFFLKLRCNNISLIPPLFQEPSFRDRNGRYRNANHSGMGIGTGLAIDVTVPVTVPIAVPISVPIPVLNSVPIVWS